MAIDLSFRHDEQPLMAAVSRLESSEPRQVLIVGGVLGSGRRHFVRRVAARLTERGKSTTLLALSLDGFEPTGPGVAGFVEFRLSFPRRFSVSAVEGEGGAWTEALAAQARQLVEQLNRDPLFKSSGRWAAAWSLLFELEAPAEVLAALVAAAAAEPLTPEKMLTTVLAQAAGAEPGRCIVHLAADSTLSDATVHWVLGAALAQPRVAVVFSCAPTLATEALIGFARITCALMRIDLPRVTPEQALLLLKAGGRAEALGWTPEQLQELAAQANTSVGRLARLLAERVGAQTQDPSTPRARVEAWLAEAGPDAPVLRRLLGWAAACGEVVPVLPLLAACEVSQADAERLIDRLDDELCGEEAALPLLEDIAYRHPGFPGLSVYRFRDHALRLALLDELDTAAQLESEKKLLQFLGQRMGIATRALAQLFVNLTERVQFDLSAGPRQRARLWIGPAEQTALEGLLCADVAAGRLPAEALFTTAQQDHALPPHARLSLLAAAAVKAGEMPGDRRVMLTGLRTELLCATGRFADALTSADAGFELLSAINPEPPGVRGLLLFLRANCQRQLGQLDAALASFQQAAEEAKKPRADGIVDHHNLGVCLAEAGHCHAERKEWVQASTLLQQGIAELRQSAMDQKLRDEQIAQLERNLAVCQAKQQEASPPAGG